MNNDNSISSTDNDDIPTIGTAVDVIIIIAIRILFVVI